MVRGVYPPYTLSGPTTKKTLFLCVSSLKQSDDNTIKLILLDSRLKDTRCQTNTAGPESLEDYFQKGALLGHTEALNLWYSNTRPNSQKLFPSIKGLSNLAYKTKKKMIIFYSNNSSVSFQWWLFTNGLKYLQKD